MPSNLLCNDRVDEGFPTAAVTTAGGGTSAIVTSCSDPLYVRNCETTYRQTDRICADNAGLACEVDRSIVRNVADNSVVSVAFIDIVTNLVIPNSDITIDTCESTVGVPNPYDSTIIAEKTVCAIVAGAPAAPILQLIIRDEDTYIRIDTLYEDIETNARIAPGLVQLVDAADCCPQCALYNNNTY